MANEFPTGALSFEEVGELLDGIAEKLPREFFDALNGGINLLPDVKEHPLSAAANDLYILGEYHNEPRGLGRYINIYYGSFIRVYSHLRSNRQGEELRRILLHEFTHHLESLAGERGLEIKDKLDMEEYRFRRNLYLG